MRAAVCHSVAERISGRQRRDLYRPPDLRGAPREPGQRTVEGVDDRRPERRDERGREGISRTRDDPSSATTPGTVNPAIE
jgi:hypothetical protein